MADLLQCQLNVLRRNRVDKYLIAGVMLAGKVVECVNRGRSFSSICVRFPSCTPSIAPLIAYMLR